MSKMAIGRVKRGSRRVNFEKHKSNWSLPGKRKLSQLLEKLAAEDVSEKTVVSIPPLCVAKVDPKPQSYTEACDDRYIEMCG